MAADEGKVDHAQLDAEGVPDKQSLGLWLAKERDGLSWQQIATKFFPAYGRKKRKLAGMSKARRVYAIVERALEPSAKEAFRQLMNGQIHELFGCTPEDFKRYLQSIKIK